MCDFLYLTVVGQRLPIECGGWSRDAIRQRGLAMAVTWSAPQGGHRIHHAGDADPLITAMAERTVVGYQIRVCDYQIIHGVLPFAEPQTLDLGEVVERVCSFKVRFEDVTRASYMPLGRMVKSTFTSSTITEMWRAGHHGRAESACTGRVNMLRYLHRIMDEGWFAYADAEGGRHEVQVPKGVLAECTR